MIMGDLSTLEVIIIAIVEVGNRVLLKRDDLQPVFSFTMLL